MIDGWWSWLLTGWTCTGLWLVSYRRTRPIGWAWCLAGEALWIVYALLTAQYGFIVGAGAFGVVYARNLWRAWGEW